MKNLFFPRLIASTLLIILLLMTGCLPLNSSFESAPTLPPGHVEVQGNVSRSFYAHDDGSSQMYITAKSIGLGLAVGVAKDFDIRLRAEALFLPHDKGSDFDFSRANYFSISPKMSFFKNQCLAFKGYYALIFIVDKKSKTALGFRDLGGQILYTPVQRPYFDLTVGCKIGAYMLSSAGLSLGMSIGRNIKRAAFRPEFGVILGAGVKPIFDAGVGCTVVFNGKKSGRER
jgi:hypothetical protein